MTHAQLVRLLANVIVNGSEEIFQYTSEILPPTTLNFGTRSQQQSTDDDNQSQHSGKLSMPEIERSSSTNNLSNQNSASESDETNVAVLNDSTTGLSDNSNRDVSVSPSPSVVMQFVSALESTVSTNLEDLDDLTKRPFLSAIFESLSTLENDYGAVFSLCLLHALHDNAGE